MALVEDLSGKLHNSCVRQGKDVLARGRGTYTPANPRRNRHKIKGDEIGERTVKQRQNLK